MPIPSDPSGDPADPTAALPVMRPEGPGASDSDAATEKLNARGKSGNGDNGDKGGDNRDSGDSGDSGQRRRGVGGGVSAQDLLRREGRL
jgi:trehalose monomycolate/heme transporter